MSASQEGQESPSPLHEDDFAEATNGNAPANKRHTACDLCRRRKLRCNGQKPSCQTCTTLETECEYTATHKKSGPQKGYLRRLESRLEQLEQRLSENIEATKQVTMMTAKRRSGSEDHEQDQYNHYNDESGSKRRKPSPSNSSGSSSVGAQNNSAYGPREGVEPIQSTSYYFERGAQSSGPSSMARVSPYHVDEPYPDPVIVNQLVDKYFEGSYPAFAFVAKLKFYENLNLGRLKPYLLYAVLMTGASLSDSPLMELEEQMYERCVYYLAKAENRGYGEEIVDLSYVQATTLLTMHENRAGCFGRAWITLGKAVRSSHVNMLHDMDALPAAAYENLELSEQLQRDEKRRTFWSIYILDKYCSVGTGWPASIREDDINTNLPLDDESFLNGVPEHLVASLDEVLQGLEMYLSGTNAFIAISVLLAYVLRQSSLLMKEKVTPEDQDPTGPWWSKYRMLAQQLSGLSKILPPVSPTPPPAWTPLTNMATSFQVNYYIDSLVLNRAAILRISTAGGPFHAHDYELRCQSAGSNIVVITQACGNIFDVVIRNPGTLLCLYMTARSIITILEEGRQIYDLGRDGAEQDFTCNMRPQLDYLVSIFKSLRHKMYMAERIYEATEAEMIRAGFSTPITVEIAANQYSMRSLQDGIDFPRPCCHPTVPMTVPMASSTPDSQSTISPSATPPSLPPRIKRNNLQNGSTTFTEKLYRISDVNISATGLGRHPQMPPREASITGTSNNQNPVSSTADVGSVRSPNGAITSSQGIWNSTELELLLSSGDYQDWPQILETEDNKGATGAGGNNGTTWKRPQDKTF